MKKSSNLALLITAASSFLGGIALGMLLSPKSGKENRTWIADNAGEMAHWADETGKKVIHLSEDQLAKLAERLRKSLDQNLPDLYKATERIDFDNGDSPQ